jgi:uracil phosphoribosyltransferase
LTVWPDATVGFLGLARDEATLTSSVYLSRLGEVTGRDVVVLEPMLATGGSLSEALANIAEAGRPASITVVGVVAAPEGVALVEAAWPQVHLVFAALDERLTATGYIYPGLGDVGDRAWGA